MLNLRTMSHVSFGNNEMIGRRFLFDVVFSGGDVGELILTYRPANKCKAWSNAAEAAARGHLHIVKWLEAATDGVAADSCAADAAATGGQLKTLQWIYQQGRRCTTGGICTANNNNQWRHMLWLLRNDSRLSNRPAQY